MRSMRPGTCGEVVSRSATTLGGTSNPTAQAATPNAFATLNRPSSGSDTGKLPRVVTNVKRAPFASTRTSRAVTSAVGDVAEKVIRRRRLPPTRSEEHTSELQSRENLVCRLLLEK